MNPFLEKLFDITAIDIKHLESYLNMDEQRYLDKTLKTIEELMSDF